MNSKAERSGCQGPGQHSPSLRRHLWIFLMQKIVNWGTRARLAKQSQRPHSLWPSRSIHKDRTGTGHHGRNSKFPFEPLLLPSFHVNPVLRSPRHPQRTPKGPPAHLSKYNANKPLMRFPFYLSCLESQEAPATKHHPAVQTARMCQSARARAKVKIPPAKHQ